MRWILAAVFSLGIATGVAAYDGEYELRSEYPDFFPGDGLFEEGSSSNPYGIYEHGDRLGTIEPRTHDFFPGDGLFEEGSHSNPYVFRLDE